MHGQRNGQNILRTNLDPCPPGDRSRIAQSSSPPTGKPSVNRVSSGSGPTPRIAVIGDIMIDVDLHCNCARICQEGPWPVLKIERTERRMGAAGNVAEMTNALGATTLLLGLVGAHDLRLPIHDRIIPGWHGVDGQTTTKTRCWVDGRLTGPRLDHDLGATTRSSDVQCFLDRVHQFRPNAIIIADHGKGVVTKELMQMLDSLDVPLFLDPVANTPLPGRNLEVATGSTKELHRSAWGLADVVVEKLAAKGLRWFRPEYAEPCGSLPSACRNLVDPLGAGDQFIGALTYQRCLGQDWAAAINWANIAAGLQCERRGCVPVTIEDVEHRMSESITRLMLAS